MSAKSDSQSATSVKRRKDTELRDAVNRMQSIGQKVQKKNNAYRLALRELSHLTHSPLAFVLELAFDEQMKPYFECRCVFHNPEDNTEAPDTDLDFRLSDFRLPIDSKSKEFYRIYMSTQAAVFDKTTIGNFPSSAGWQAIDGMISIPVSDGGKPKALIVLCNSAEPYRIELNKRIWPLLSSLLNMLRIIETRENLSHSNIRPIKEDESARENYSIIEQLSPSGILVLDSKLNILRINPASEQIFGFEAHDLLGKSVINLLPESYPNEHALRTFSVQAHTNQKRTNHNIQIKGVTRAGQTVVLQASIVPIRENHQPCILVLLKNLAEINEIQNQLEGELQRFRALTDLAPMGILQTDQYWHTSYVNKQWLEITSIEEEQTVGLNWTHIFQGINAEANIADLHKSLLNHKVFKRELQYECPNGTERWIIFHARPLLDINGNVDGFLASIIDNTYYHHSETKLRDLAERDPLTRLANRTLLLERLEHAISHKQRRGAVALLSLDLDGFKNINDSMGHEAGDRLLIEVAKRVSDILREEDLLARIGGDEFIVLLERIAEAEVASIIAIKILKALREPFEIDNQEVFISTSIGICFSVAGQKSTCASLLKQADIALYRAKAEGRNNFQYYTPDLDLVSKRRLELGNSLHRALNLGEFEVYYQPQLSVSDNVVVGFEALIRWNHPEKGLIAPDEFIPLLEEIGLIAPVGRWIAHSCFMQLREWIDAKLVSEDAVMSVNVSPRQFRDSQFLQSVKNSMVSARLSGKNVTIEITETALLQDNLEVKATLEAFHEANIGIALDDFGTGYASLSHLKKYPISVIKIDRSFIKDLPYDEEDIAITDSVLALAEAFKLKVVAEGVDSDEILECLKERDCHTYQGYLFSKPLAAKDIPDKIKQ
ncbi:EAL domain-containing protein [Reinekea marina]|uniref:EAL domain-containing protein n=2 Tax=Reinekea marina TaxID=1310421 RepID=A0ABV7WU81_9GAMM